eukprot:Seg1209.1 transcript_id=Seg1209.1/GoldUCD/mRNA.D3Y31 product="hypothetical protein" protein_id=Seg1209.1/GoldUCD/D3Y31
MAAQWWGGIGQAIVGGLGTAATLGLNEDVKKWTCEGASKVAQNTEKAWGADGEVTKFMEAVPGVGYVASAGHGIAAAVTGDEEHLQRARRACAASTKSSLVTAGAVGGGIVGGPAGAVAGASLGSISGQCSEKGINHANDKKFQTGGGTFHNFDAGSFATEVAIDGALAGIGSAAGKVGKDVARTAVGPSLKEVGGGGVKRYIAKRGCEKAVSAPVAALAGNELGKLKNRKD